jgi:hypothetical protein
MVDRLERLTDLVLVLLRDQRPKSLREIASEVPGYPVQEGEARRQAFERDKRTLRDGDIEVTAPHRRARAGRVCESGPDTLPTSSDARRTSSPEPRRRRGPPRS